jgi:phi13 family phage major tail protein
MAKKALKGFSGLRIFPVTKNDATGYTVGEKIVVSGSQNFTTSPEQTEWKIQADDGIYDSGADFNGIKFTLTLAECPLSLKPYFEGGEYNETTKEYDFSSISQAPELGLGFKALQTDGTWLMVKLWSAKCTSFKVDYKTKGESGDIAAVTIEGTIQNRIYDNKVKREKEAALETDLTWLDTMETLPQV